MPAPISTHRFARGGHEVADTVRDAMGPQAGGTHGGGRMTGKAVYRHLEKPVDPPDPKHR